MELSVLDQTTLSPWYIRNILCFQFEDCSKRAQAVQQLKNGLQATFAHWPFLAGFVKPDHSHDYKRTGRHIVHYDRVAKDVERSKRFSADYQTENSFPWTYQNMLSDGMPASELKENAIVSLDWQQSIDGPLPITHVKVTFIEGGLFLAIYIHHMVCDGVGATVVCKQFADNVRNRVTRSKEGKLL